MQVQYDKYFDERGQITVFLSASVFGVDDEFPFYCRGRNQLQCQ